MPDRLGAMQVFAAVVDAQGFAPAARRLRLSPSVVTRMIAGLEERLGVRLLQRTTRNVSLTDAGARFLERTRAILAAVEEAEALAQDEHAEPRGLLVITAPLLFGRSHVAPIVGRLLATHPELSIELRLSDLIANLVEEGIDLAIRIGHLTDSALIATRYGQTRRTLVASPSYLEARGTPATPAELVHHDMIGFRAIIPGSDWVFPAATGKPVVVSRAPRFLTNSGEAALDYATSGGGITAAYCYQVDASVRAGRLVEVLKRFSPEPAPIHAVFPTSRLMSRKTRSFLDAVAVASRGWHFLEPRGETPATD